MSEPGLPAAPIVVALEGEPWLFIDGNLAALDGPYVLVRRRTRAEIMEYIGGHDLAATSPPIALFRRLEFRRASKRAWADLTESTKRGYRGRLRSLGIRSEADMARFHAEADSATLKWLRRKGPRPRDLVVVNGRPLYDSRGAGSWGAIWGQKSSEE